MDAVRSAIPDSCRHTSPPRPNRTLKLCARIYPSFLPSLSSFSGTFYHSNKTRNEYSNKPVTSLILHKSSSGFGLCRNPTPPPSLLLSSLMSALDSHSQLSPGRLCSLSPFLIPDVFLLTVFLLEEEAPRGQGAFFFFLFSSVSNLILYPKDLEMFSAHCKHSINTCGMNERMNESGASLQAKQSLIRTE